MTATTQTIVTFRVKIALLFFAFNFFYGGIEVGYAGLVMSYAVTYLDWSKDDGRLADWRRVPRLCGVNQVVSGVCLKQGRRYNARVSAAGIQRPSHRSQRLSL